MVKHYGIFQDVLSKHVSSDKSIDVSKHLMDLFFDVISELTLGESFNALTSGVRDPIVREFLQYQQSAGFINMWMFHLLRSIPIAASHLLYMLQWYSSAISQKKEVRQRSARKRQWYKAALQKRAQVCQCPV